MNADGILAVNLGSSSIKLALYAADGAERIAHGEVARVGQALQLRMQRAAGASLARALPGACAMLDGLDAALDWLDAACADYRIAAIGHRVVHGGSRPERVLRAAPDVLRELDALDPLAPQHQPANLAGVRRLQARYPHAQAFVCFDTAFHCGWEDAAARLALPRRFHEAGVRRYGFHGLSFEYLSATLRRELPWARRAVLAHLGSGASLCAVRDGRSIDCTMGFSVLDGLPMATRSGAIDPGVIFHLQRQFGLTFEAVEHLLYYDSGLKGVSGLSGDMRELLAAAEPAAKEAVALFTYHCVRGIGAMTAVLGGLDALVFSGGIGTHAPPVRAAICARLGAFGIELDARRNAAGGGRISLAASRVPVFAWPTDEESVIAAHCAAAWQGATSASGASPLRRDAPVGSAG